MRQLEERVHKLTRPMELIEDSSPDLPEQYYKVLEYLGKVFGDNISLKRSAGGKGSITLRFSSDEEMNRLLELLEN